jgi:hypothetical protein
VDEWARNGSRTVHRGSTDPVLTSVTPPLQNKSSPRVALLPDVRLAVRLTAVFAGAILAAWFWSRICRFPSIPWNDMRLAPTIALAQGWPVYPTPSGGTINTWMYGPLPLLFFWPASWAGTAAGALMVAAVLNFLLTLVPLALVCFAWPAGEPGSGNLMGRTAALILCLAIWPELQYSVHFSDNLAIACGLLANLLLVRARSAPILWLAAVTATAAASCKQICIGIPLAHVLWLGLTAGRGAAIQHAARCIVAGALIGAAAVAMFGWEGLWFALIDIPGNLDWTAEPINRLIQAGPALALQLLLPAAIMVSARRRFAEPALLLPAVAFICALPLGIAALLKVGGWTNSIHSFVLWLPAVLTTALTTKMPERRRWLVQLAAVITAAAIACGRLVTEPNLKLRPELAAYREAEQLADGFRGALWFPLHPLITLYSDHRYYHDEDGMYIRMKANKRLSPQQAVHHLPPDMRAMAFRNDWNDWGIARRMLPPNSHASVNGHWTLWSGIAEIAQP